MSKLKNVVVAFLVLWVFTVIPAFPQGNAGCKNGKFIGSYTHVDDFPDVWGDGSASVPRGVRAGWWGTYTDKRGGPRGMPRITARPVRD